MENKIQSINQSINPLQNCFSQDEMIGIMKMCKEEGNDLFKERNYTAAGEYYTHAIALACNMERKEGKPIETELISSVFCNRAACLHKMVCNLPSLCTAFKKYLELVLYHIFTTILALYLQDYYEDAISNCNMGTLVINVLF